MYGEKCRECGLVESAHDVAQAITEEIGRGNPELIDEQVADLAFYKLQEPALPCESFESEVDHKPRCPVFIDYNGQEIYCQDLPGGCEELMRHP